MAERGYEFLFSSAVSDLSRVSVANERELTAREDKIRIPKRSCNVLFIL